MKMKFILLTLMLLFSRGCDFYSTSLWFFQEGGKEGERNPLTYFFGVGWTGLIVSNTILILGIIGLLYYFFFHYKRTVHFSHEPRNYQELASLQYFDQPDKFYQIFYKSPKNRRVLFAHFGYVLTIVVIVGSFLATFHNLSQFYSFEFYNQFRQLVIRPLFVIYALIILTMILTYRSLLKREYEQYQGFK